MARATVERPGREGNSVFPNRGIGGAIAKGRLAAPEDRVIRVMELFGVAEKQVRRQPTYSPDMRAAKICKNIFQADRAP